MEEVIGAAEANRSFSRILRQVAGGGSFLVTDRGRPVARIIPVDAHGAERAAARRALLERLERQPAEDIGAWRRDELYDSDA